MAIRKNKDKKAILACSGCMGRNYSVPKSIAFIHERLEFKKYCRTCSVHTVHRETR
jgi:large subunit ribosomal protein L33